MADINFGREFNLSCRTGGLIIPAQRFLVLHLADELVFYPDICGHTLPKLPLEACYIKKNARCQGDTRSKK
ncbi:MAG: hypothetical protein R6W72_09185 [Desulfurivibrionaceae bacterium]